MDRIELSIKWSIFCWHSDLCDYSDTYIVVKGTIINEEDDDNKKRDKKTKSSSYDKSIYLLQRFECNCTHFQAINFSVNPPKSTSLSM